MLCAFALLDIVLIYGLVEPSVPPAVAVAVAGAAAIAIGGPDPTTADIYRTIISIKVKGARVDGQCIWQTSSPTISTT